MTPDAMLPHEPDPIPNPAPATFDYAQQMEEEDRQQREQIAAMAGCPKPPMPDLKAWISRVQEFFGKLRKLPGTVDRIEEQFNSPISLNDLEEQSLSLLHPLPESLKTFLCQGSGHLQLHYCWTPRNQSQLSDDLTMGDCVWGGPRIGPMARLVKDQVECELFGLECKGDGQEQAIWLRTIPFLRMDNGDYLAFDPETGSTDPIVMYLCHDDLSFALAPNLAAFLMEWEQLCYVGPEHWKLREFQDPQTRRLVVDSPQAKKRRERLGAEG